MNEKALRDELAKFKRSYRRIVSRNTELENQFEAQEARIAVLSNNLVQCQKALDMNKTLIRQFGDEHSRKEQAMASFINALKAKLRELGYGDFNKLGDSCNICA